MGDLGLPLWCSNQEPTLYRSCEKQSCNAENRKTEGRHHNQQVGRNQQPCLNTEQELTASLDAMASCISIPGTCKMMPWKSQISLRDHVPRRSRVCKVAAANLLYPICYACVGMDIREARRGSTVVRLFALHVPGNVTDKLRIRYKSVQDNHRERSERYYLSTSPKTRSCSEGRKSASDFRFYPSLGSLPVCR